MIKKWLDNLLPKKHTTATTTQHYPKKFNIQHLAVAQVLEKLHQAHYEAYLVGGAVRDMLLGVIPKDYDVATNATPEEVTKLFRRSRIIGKRFPIVHVMIGKETIEVSTFRSGGKQVRHNEHGRIMRDNTYGNLSQDAMRRDFTCNALYYDAHKQHIIDHHQGISDIQAKRLVMIGNPAERYQEDPVRILRAIRLSGKLGFDIDAQTAAPIAHYASLLKQEPVARLFDELLKILFSGHASSCLKQIDQLGIRCNIHPMLNAMQSAAQEPNTLAAIALAQTDQRLSAQKTVSVGFILAAMFWAELTPLWQQAQAAGQSSAAAMNTAINDLRDKMEKGWGVPQRYSATMREIWSLQPQFDYRRGARPHRLLHQARFRAAYDFLLLRSELDSSLKELAQWWTQFQYADNNKREEMAAQAPMPANSGSKRRKPRKKKTKTND